jgi:hypothetical protein
MSRLPITHYQDWFLFCIKKEEDWFPPTIPLLIAHPILR